MMHVELISVFEWLTLVLRKDVANKAAGGPVLVIDTRGGA